MINLHAAYLFIRVWISIRRYQVVFTFWILWIMLYAYSCASSWWAYVFISLGTIFRREIVVSYDNVMFHLLRNYQKCFPKWLYYFLILLAVYGGSNFSTSSPALIFYFVLILAILVGIKKYLMVALSYISPIIDDFKYLSMCLVNICILYIYFLRNVYLNY